MLISTHTRSSGASVGTRQRKTAKDTVDHNPVRPVFERADDGRRPGSGWRRPRNGLVRPRDLEDRITDAPLSTARSAPNSVATTPDPRPAEFWTLLHAIVPGPLPDAMSTASPTLKPIEPSLQELLALVAAAS